MNRVTGKSGVTGNQARLAAASPEAKPDPEKTERQDRHLKDLSGRFRKL